MKETRGRSLVCSMDMNRFVTAAACAVAYWGAAVLLRTRRSKSAHAKSGAGLKERYVVAVGTSNNGKIDALKTSLKRWNRDHLAVVSTPVPSGVSDQPLGVEETLLGAKNRAKRALEKCEERCTFGAGIESGVLLLKTGGQDKILDFCAVALYDGKKYHIGLSGFWELPSRVAAEFLKLGYNAAFKAGGVEPDDRGLGVLGYLSNGRLSRPSQTSEAIEYALLSVFDKGGIYSSR